MSGSDVKSGHLQSSGYIYKSRARVKAFDLIGTASAGVLELWDTDVVPVTTGTYGRSGTTVTVADTAHGLTTGDAIGISFDPDGGVIATNGNYFVTVLDADTFTVTDINSGTIANDPSCRYVASSSNGINAEWKATFPISATDVFYNGFNVPDEGLLCRKSIYVFVENLASVNIFYS